MPGIIDNIRTKAAESAKRRAHEALMERHAPRRRIVIYTLPPIELITDHPPSELGPLLKGSKIEMRCDATSVGLVGRWLAEGVVRWSTITPAERLDAAREAVAESRGE